MAQSRAAAGAEVGARPAVGVPAQRSRAAAADVAPGVTPDVGPASEVLPSPREVLQGVLPAPRRPAAVRRLGEALSDDDVVPPGVLAAALERVVRTGEPLGRVLTRQGYARRTEVWRRLAEQWGHPFVDLLVERFDDTLAAQVEPRTLVGLGCVPLRVEDGWTVVATCERPDGARARAVRAALAGTPAGGLPVRWCVTTEWDVAQAVLRTGGPQLLDDATEQLRREHPLLSASQVVDRRQSWVLAGLGALVVVAAVLDPHVTAVAAVLGTALLFAGSVLFKAVTGVVGMIPGGRSTVPADDVAALQDADLPRYTVLVPAYREANVVAGLLANIDRLDYPREKLEVLLLLEEDDGETLAAAKAAAPSDVFRFVVVPPGEPRTKPKACNVGLALATGEMLTIYDAEDRPEPDQLRTVVAAFRRGGPDLVVVQAALSYFNATENLLTRLFTLEYAAWFDLMLPAMDRMRLTIPLGGTSNHFRTQALRDIGGWDPFNVTEDADLGVRVAALGKQVSVVRSTTFEEANVAVGNWLRQRSRWIKGYMQTALVHSRRPAALVAATGWRGAGSFALLVAGTPVTFLAAPVLWVLSLVGAATGLFTGPWGHLVGVVTVVNLVVSYGLSILVTAAAAVRRRWWGLVPFALLLPLYWVLHSIAAWKGLVQLVRNPFYWEKTTHGLSRELGTP